MKLFFVYPQVTKVHIILFPYILYPFQTMAMTGSVLMTVAIALERYYYHDLITLSSVIHLIWSCWYHKPEVGNSNWILVETNLFCLGQYKYHKAKKLHFKFNVLDKMVFLTIRVIKRSILKCFFVTFHQYKFIFRVESLKNVKVLGRLYLARGPGSCSGLP